LIATLNFLEQNLKFFRNENTRNSEKLTNKQMEYDSFYMEYVLEGQTLCNFIKENKNLKKDYEILKESFKDYHRKFEIKFKLNTQN